MMTSFFKTSVVELKAVKKSSHLHTIDHGYGTNIITSLWERKNTGIFCCQSGESDRALMQQSRTQKVRTLKEMEVSTTTTNTSITNGLGILQFLPGKDLFYNWWNWVPSQRYGSFLISLLNRRIHERDHPAFHANLRNGFNLPPLQFE